MPLVLVIAVSVIVRIWYIFQPIPVWWDTAIYMGMGKHFFTGGHVGLIESFRPPLFPIVMGVFWKLGLDPVFWGKVLMVATGTACVYLTYRIAEKVKAGTGIYAALLLSLSPVFLFFTAVPLTDIPSTFFILLSMLYMLDNKPGRSGLSLAAAFLLRFPQGLMLLPLTALAIRQPRSLARLYAGFILPLIPYFIKSSQAFGNPLAPILHADRVATASYGVHGSVFYYFFTFIYQNAFLAFSIVLPIAYAWMLRKNYKKAPGDKPVLLVLLSLAIVGGYFSIITHKELRYGIPFLPFLCISAAYGIWFALQKSTYKYKQLLASTIIAATLMTISGYAYATQAPKAAESAERLAYYNYFTFAPRAKVLTTTPHISALNDVKTLEIFSSWPEFAEDYERYKHQYGYIALDSCMFQACDSDECKAQRARMQMLLTQENAKLLERTDGQCELAIYKKK